MIIHPFAGNPHAKIRNLKFTNVAVQRRGDAERLKGSGGKPRGNVEIETQSGSVDYSGMAAELVVAHALDVVVDGLRLPECAARAGREGLALVDVAFRETVAPAWGPACEDAGTRP